MSLTRGLRSPRSWLASANLLAGLITGVLFLAVLIGILVSAACVPLGLVSLPILGLMLRCGDALAAVERARCAALAGAPIPSWPADSRRGYRWLLIPRRVTVLGRATWGEIGYALLFPVVGIVTAVAVLIVWLAGLALVAAWFTLVAAWFAVITTWWLGFALVTLPLYAWRSLNASRSIGGHPLRVAPVLARSVVTAARALLTLPWATSALSALSVSLAGWLLAPPKDLAARVAELEVSRDRVVDAAEAERRRIERDLHDGAQQRLVALAMELGRAKAKFGDDPEAARELVGQAHAQAKEALTELRNLVRGVHPPVLTDRGLDAAISGLAALCPVPVDAQVDVAVRPKAAVEAVAYFVVAEALTNVAKHARASQVRVLVEGHGFPGSLTVLISDDGIGGADPRGAGLSGLADRVSGVDGELSVESPSGGPTIISAVLPCG
jgi:signal transduction histidine kinase